MQPSLAEKISYFSYRTNWHKHPLISRIMCWMGRHDYEYAETLYDSQGDPHGAKLECFYCLQQKGSVLLNVIAKKLDESK